jgi:hypothetical protein
MATSYVKTTMTQIHSLIQASGLHFIINSTPFSSYITIRKKVINSEQIPLNEATPMLEPHQDELEGLREV